MIKESIKEVNTELVIQNETKKEEVQKPNRHSRRAAKAFERKLPQIIKKMKISSNIKDTKALGRIAKQKHIDEVKERTAKRKEIKKLQKLNE